MTRVKEHVLSPEEIINIYKSLVVGRTFVSRPELVKLIENNTQCSRATAYGILREHENLFLIKNGEYRLGSEILEKNKVAPDLTPYVEAEKFLGEVTVYLTTQQNVEDFLILIGVVRDQLRDGIWAGFDKLLLLLEQKYGEQVGGLIEKGETVREASGGGTETAVPETETEFYEESEEGTGILTEEEEKQQIQNGI